MLSSSAGRVRPTDGGINRPYDSLDPDARNGNDELPVPFANVGQLLNDFVLQVPGQNQNIVRTCFRDALRSEDWDMRAREKLALFVRITVDGIVQKILANTTVVQQRISFAGRAIAYNGFSRPLRLNQKIEQVPLDGFYLTSKSGVGVDAMEPGGFLLLTQSMNVHGKWLGSIFRMTGIDTQGASVSRKLLHIE